jgi:hypothetical protein
MDEMFLENKKVWLHSIKISELEDLAKQNCNLN